AVLPWEDSFQEASSSYAFRSKVSMSHRRKYTKSRVTEIPPVGLPNLPYVSQFVESLYVYATLPVP
ncbi:MAG: hypothetical protein WAW19_01435, partial [Bifidobacterium adolescentis]